MGCKGVYITRTCYNDGINNCIDINLRKFCSLRHTCTKTCACESNPLFTADNQLNAKPVVKQRHPGDEFPVSQRGSTKGKQSSNARVWKPLIWTKMNIFWNIRMLFCQSLHTKGYGKVFPPCCHTAALHVFFTPAKHLLRSDFTWGKNGINTTIFCFFWQLLPCGLQTRRRADCV